MKVDEWLQFFRQHPQKKLFSISDLAQLVEEPASSISVQLTRLIHTKVITRVAHGWYANPFYHPSAEEVAMVLRVPCYLSLEYALSRRGVLSQHVYTVTLVTSRPPYTFHTEKVSYEYHQIHKSLFWGYEDEQGILVGTVEKALLDLLYIRGVRTKEFTTSQFRSLLDDMDLELLQKQRLRDYAKRFGKGTRALAVELDLLTK
jgi:predicted transcriptional regulator of viral defense system